MWKTSRPRGCPRLSSQDENKQSIIPGEPDTIDPDSDIPASNVTESVAKVKPVYRSFEDAAQELSPEGREIYFFTRLIIELQQSNPVLALTIINWIDIGHQQKGAEQELVARAQHQAQLNIEAARNLEHTRFKFLVFICFGITVLATVAMAVGNQLIASLFVVLCAVGIYLLFHRRMSS